MHRRFPRLRVPFVALVFVLLGFVNCQSDAVVDPSEDSAKKPEIDPETQLNALRIYYAAKTASEEANPAEAFEKNIANVTFSNDDSKKKSYDLAFASACASGEIPVDIFFSRGTDVNGEHFSFELRLLQVRESPVCFLQKSALFLKYSHSQL
jgi:hypothetical protein